MRLLRQAASMLGPTCSFLRNYYINNCLCIVQSSRESCETARPDLSRQGGADVVLALFDERRGLARAVRLHCGRRKPFLNEFGQVRRSAPIREGPARGPFELGLPAILGARSVGSGAF